MTFSLPVSLFHSTKLVLLLIGDSPGSARAETAVAAGELTFCSERVPATPSHLRPRYGRSLPPEAAADGGTVRPWLGFSQAGGRWPLCGSLRGGGWEKSGGLAGMLSSPSDMPPGCF